MPPNGHNKVTELFDLLLQAESQCGVYKKNAGKNIPNVNFNKRQDLLIKIDEFFLLFLKLERVRRYAERTFYSKWTSRSKRGPEDEYLKHYSSQHHPTKVLSKDV